MNLILPVLLAFTLLLVFYHYTFRKVLLDMQRYRLFALRDEVRMMGVKGVVAPQTFEFQYIERMLCFLTSACPKLTLSRFIEMIIMKRDIQEPPEAKRFNENAPEDLKEIEKKAIRYFLLTMFVNSPTFALILIGVAIGADIFGRIKHGWDCWMQTNARLFAELAIFKDGMGGMTTQ